MNKGRPQQRGKSYGEERTFGGIEKFAVNWRLSRARNFLRQLDTSLLSKPKKILELGCGYWGRNLSALRREFTDLQFTGVDLSVTRTDLGFQMIEADLSDWQPAELYDGVLSLAVLEHLIDPQVHFQLIAKCLAPGGVAGLTSPTPQAHGILTALAGLKIFDRDEIADHKLYFTETGICLLADSAGLTVEDYTRFSLGMNQWALLRKS